MSDPFAKSDRHQRWLILVTVLLFGVFLVWANATRLDLVTRGQGRVVPLGQNFSVQVPYSGTIVAFFAQEGARVEEGSVIAEINPTEAAGALAEAEKRLQSLNLRLARLDAEMAGAVFDISEVQADGELEATLLRAELASSNARRADLDARVSALVQARLQRERDAQALQAELTGIQEEARLLSEEAAYVSPLVDSGVLGLDERFRLDRAGSSLDTRSSVLNEQYAAIEFAISEINARIESARAEFQNAILTERVDVLSQMSELTQRLPSLRLRVSQTEIRAPVTGILNQVFFNRAGAVVGQGETIAEIVPETTELRVETLIAPRDIANVEPGQPVRISLTAYDAAKFGALDGEVLRVSADATMREELQERMFVVETSILGVIEDVDGEPVRILPGMIAQVDVIRGDRSILEYFWNPVIKVRDRAFRE
ncbi:HlyD family type I secretion periplasmic adaptor subunit [Octadecabacter sp. G9-8]|uniref:Membrane fusion protein (MFP) family protein n=1 Tax=Octadecabacter dasysiphoniae TaxID=2909341 RepID=A0ABS9CX63_9RHOB|nr:HlyD family type I secretion periplasmic adaptor subunit [Octadecabacter dasysiphoniae]MCF2871866.1 HlyD family type I secretion periplasmic adaptor subunit [Octadecabacter dasysiphoniae]